MKKVFSFFVLATVALSMGLTACSDEDTASELVVNTSKTATVTGIAHATLDNTITTGDPQYAPSGTKVFLKTPYSNIVKGGSSSTYYVVETTVGSGGQFTATVPVTDNGTTYSVVGNNFTASKRLTADKSETYKYTASPVSTPSLQVGASGFVTLEYGDGTSFK